MNVQEELTKFMQSERYQSNKDWLEVLFSYLDDLEKKPMKSFLKTTDILTAPASTKYHGNYFGGLMEHIVNVYNILVDLGFDSRKAAKIALIHDFCKLNFYTPYIKQGDWRDMTEDEYKEYKQNNPSGRATRIRPEEIGFKIKNDPKLGHGEYSLIIAIKNNIPLTIEEMQMIRWHMGLHDYTTYSFYEKELLKQNPDVLKVQYADHISSLMEDGNPNE